MNSGHARGRSFHDGKQHISPGSVNAGNNFREQWKRAFSLQPPFVMVTGWNEWTAGRWIRPGNPLTFVDQYDEEFSRDIEPMKGGHGDNYYYQLVNYIRRYKGVRSLPPVVSAPIQVDGNLADWRDVTPEFRDTIGDPVHRDHASWKEQPRLLNRTGRNDLLAAKVSADATNIYFYVRTGEPLTPATGSNWMLLFIDADHNPKTGWLGYDFVVNRSGVQLTRTTIERNVGGHYQWSSPVAIISRAAGNELQLAVPKSVLGITGDEFTLDFKWADNIQQTGDWSDFTLNGDVAPNDRFNYRAAFVHPENINWVEKIRKL